MIDLYAHCVSFRGLSRLLALLGCGVDETWLSIRGVKRPVEQHIQAIDEDDLTTGTGSAAHPATPGPEATAGSRLRPARPLVRAPDGPQHGLKHRTEPTGTGNRPMTARNQYQRD